MSRHIRDPFSTPYTTVRTDGITSLRAERFLAGNPACGATITSGRSRSISRESSREIGTTPFSAVCHERRGPHGPLSPLHPHYNHTAVVARGIVGAFRKGRSQGHHRVARCPGGTGSRAGGPA